MKKELVLSAKNIHKTYSNPHPVSVLNGISIELEKGQSIAIMGKSGEGKSTLLNVLGSLERSCSGEIEICGLPFSTTPLAAIRNKHIGFIFQSYHLLDDYTVLDNVLMPAKIARLPTSIGSPSHQRALQLLEAVNLSARAKFRTKLLSGGEKQRVAIARALCNDPDLILADEPSGNLDSIHSQEVHALLLRLCKEQNKTLVVATHDQKLAKLCDSIYSLECGKLTLL